jgi:pilus assembly protein FimV
MNKNALRFLVASALLSPATLYALGLGEIRLNSALNQPFDAEIEVVSGTADELNSLKVALAGEDMFRRYGLDRPNFLSSFSLRVDSAAAGRPVIKLRSPNAVTEPFLNLLVEVSWTGGRVLREYTVLLDPPVFAPTLTPDQVLTPRGQSAAANSAAGSIERPADTSVPASTTTPVAPAATTRTANIAGDSYTVKPADTLSKIARDLNTGVDVTDRQAMVALYRANPQAFAGNMNVLLAGSVLRIPPTADMAAVGNSEASTEISRQYGAWRNAASTAPAAEDRLRLVPAQQAGTGGAAQTPAGAAAANERVRALETQLAEARRLLDLRNAELAQMQQRLAATASGGTAAAPSETSVPAETAASSTASTEAEAGPPAESAEPPVSQETAPPAAESTPAVPSLFERLSQYGLWLIIAGLALIVGLIAYFRRRQQMAEDEEEAGATLTARDFESHLSRSPARRAETTDDDVDTDEHQALDFGAARPVAYVAPAAEPMAQLSEDTLSSETAIHVDQQDALAEADFHMAYGLYDQAADIVKLAIERQPERRELKLKLAEIFFVWGNKDGFLDITRQLHDTQSDAAPGEWDKVLIMGKQICPDDALFAGDIAGSRSADSIDLNLEGGEHRVDIDIYDAPEGDQPKSDLDFELASTGSRTAATADSGLDFLLDEPQRGVDDEPTREMDPNARTQETPTIESPFLHDRGSATIREKLDTSVFDQADRTIEQTAELSLDEIGLDVSDLETTGTVADDTQQIGDDDMTRLAERHRNFDPTSDTKTMLAPHMDEIDEAQEEESTGNTITVEQIDFGAGDTAEQQRPSVDGTGMFKATQKIDVDLDSFDLSQGDTVEQVRPEVGETGIFRATQRIDMDLDRLSDPFGLNSEADTQKTHGPSHTASDVFSEEVFSGEKTVVDRSLDGLQDTNATDLNATELMSGEFELPEMEPATMSEVGTKLDLARAYMDMGDPDGARSILQEVLDEGNGSQKQEAQRLLDSIG